MYSSADFKGMDTFLAIMFILAIVGFIALLAGGGWFIWWCIKHISITVS
jgi:hypothetical protein